MKDDTAERDDLIVGDGLVVSLAYSLRLDDGEEIDTAAGDDPLVYLHGAQNIIPGLERALAGLKIGDARSVTVSPDDAYGEMDPDAFELVPYDAFPGDLELEEGMGPVSYTHLDVYKRQPPIWLPTTPTVFRTSSCAIEARRRQSGVRCAGRVGLAVLLALFGHDVPP